MTTKSQILFSHEHHNEKPVVSIWFKYDQLVINKPQKAIWSTWSSAKKCWYIWQSEFELNPFSEQFGDIANIDYSALNLKFRTATSKSGSREYSRRTTIKFPINYFELLKQQLYSTSTLNKNTAY